MKNSQDLVEQNGRNEEDISALESITEEARMVLREGMHTQFEQLLLDAASLEASERERWDALMYVINTGGHVLPMERFLIHEDEPGCDDEDAAVRALSHFICSPEFPDVMQAHPEWAPFLL